MQPKAFLFSRSVNPKIKQSLILRKISKISLLNQYNFSTDKSYTAKKIRFIDMNYYRYDKVKIYIECKKNSQMVCIEGNFFFLTGTC